jgi:hypothetical protein
VTKDKTVKSVVAQFTPATSAPGPAQEQPGAQPLGQCNCNASLDLKVACVPQWEAPPPPPPVAQASPITCCSYEIPLTPRGLSFLEYMRTGALTVEAYSREGYLIASFCSNGETMGAFDSDMGADTFRLSWRHRLGLLLPEGFTGWIQRDGFHPTDGAMGIGFGGCWIF